MDGWEKDKQRSDRFICEIAQILGQYLIVEPPIEEDQQRNTDLIVLGMSTVRIACRVRQYEYFSRYQNEFTIRVSRPSGKPTELTKIIYGWGDYLFYGFANKANTRLHAWRLINLSEFRLWFMRQLQENEGRSPGILLSNRDNSSDFRAFKVNEINPACIVAGYVPEEAVNHDMD